jgi:hypothetical protein
MTASKKYLACVFECSQVIMVRVAVVGVGVGHPPRPRLSIFQLQIEEARVL